jgi:hypothetical protein
MGKFRGRLSVLVQTELFVHFFGDVNKSALKVLMFVL